MGIPRIVSADEWLAERKELLAAEKQAAEALTRAGERRRELPAVRVEKEYLLDRPAGKVSLGEMFEGRLQLIVQHFMFDPAWEEGCPVCSYQADSVGNLAHLHARKHHVRGGVARADRQDRAVPATDGLVVPVVLVPGSDFNYDFHVTHDEDVTPTEWNFMTKQELIDADLAYFAGPGERGGVSVFYRDGDTVLHTYSAYLDTIDLICANDQYLDLTPLGRQEEDVELRHHDRYAGNS